MKTRLSAPVYQCTLHLRRSPQPPTAPPRPVVTRHRASLHPPTHGKLAPKAAPPSPASSASPDLWSCGDARTPSRIPAASKLHLQDSRHSREYGQARLGQAEISAQQPVTRVGARNWQQYKRQVPTDPYKAAHSHGGGGRGLVLPSSAPSSFHPALIWLVLPASVHSSTLCRGVVHLAAVSMAGVPWQVSLGCVTCSATMLESASSTPPQVRMNRFTIRCSTDPLIH